MADFIPSSDTIYQDWLANFITVANANLSTLGLLSTEMTALSTDKSDFDTAITDSETKQAAAKAATERKKLTRETSEVLARALVKRIQARTGVTNDLKAQLQITVPGSGSGPTPIPFPPTDLVANIVGSGSYELKWKRNGNATNTLFVIEALIGTASTWATVFVTSKLTYTHAGNTPGVRIVYRVKGQHGEIQGPFSNYAIVNDVIIPVSPV
ncbi:MAG: fibronectin type III domain-containing protein [Candidatus Kapabacteria bacterium]|nr:fibronectin type III domain-containing protein [Candidatus Kapabacteria bacterium]